jgi:chaperonin GroEL
MGHRHIIIMARAFTETAIQTCLKQQEAGVFLYPLNAPYTDQAEIMKDLQVILGGRFIASETDTLDSLQVSDVGFATHVLAKRMSTIFAGNGDREKIDARVEVLKQKFEGSPSQFEKRNLTQRIAQLTNGFALLKIGAKSDTERKYLKDKADDAVNAVKAAYQEGVVKGGGQALFDIAKELPNDYILANALMAPYLQLKHNAGQDFVIPEWVMDSVKVTRIGLEKACSAAGILATAAGAITTRKKKDNCCHNKE